MFFSRALVAFVLALVSFFALACVESTTPPTDGMEPEIGAITIKVVSMDRNAVPMTGVKVAINDADGELLLDGTTDSNGEFVADDMTAGASATVADENSPFGGLLQTKFALKPGKTYQFSVTNKPTILGTITVNGTNIPGGVLFTDVKVGECHGSLGSSFTITSNCVQTDGKFSVYAEGMGSDRTIYGRALKTDLTFTNNMTVTLSDWYTPTSTMGISSFNAPAELTSAFFDVEFERRGTYFTNEALHAGAVSGTSFTGAAIAVPTLLPDATGGHGFNLSYQHALKSAAAIKAGGFYARKQWVEAAMILDSSKLMPGVDIQSLLPDFSDLTRPAMTWTIAAPELTDAALAAFTWVNGSTTVTWLGATPTETGYAKVPVLPTSMSALALPSGGVVQGPILFVADWTHGTGYDAFVESNVSETVVMRRLPENGAMEDTFKYIAGSSTDTVLRKTPTGESSESEAIDKFALLFPIVRTQLSN